MKRGEPLCDESECHAFTKKNKLRILQILYELRYYVEQIGGNCYPQNTLYVFLQPAFMSGNMSWRNHPLIMRNSGTATQNNGFK